MAEYCSECGKEMQIKIKKGYDIYSGETETQIAVCKDCKITREITAKQNNVTITDVLEKFNATDTPNETHKSPDGYCPKCGMKMRTQSKKEGYSAIHGYSYRVYNICDECSIIEDLGVVNETDVKRATRNKVAIKEEKPNKMAKSKQESKELIKNRPLSIENYIGVFLSVACICIVFMPYAEATLLGSHQKYSIMDINFITAGLMILLSACSVYFFMKNQHRDCIGMGILTIIDAVYNSSNFKIYFKEEYQHLVSLSSAAYMWLILGAGILVCGIALRNANIQYIKQNNND